MKCSSINSRRNENKLKQTYRIGKELIRPHNQIDKGFTNTSCTDKYVLYRDSAFWQGVESLQKASDSSELFNQLMRC
jgi:hypothetical protein